MQAKIVVFFAGLVVGIAMMFALRPAGQPASSPPPPAPEPPPGELAEAKSRTDRLEGEVAALRTELQRSKERETKGDLPPPLRTQAKTNAISPWAAFFGGGSDTNRADAMQKVMKAALKQRVESQVAGLKTRLHLTEDQEQAFRAALEKQYGLGLELAGRMAEGKLTKEETEQATKAADVKAILKQVLTPEQCTEYERYEVEQRQSHAQLMANNELMQVQPMLQLTEEQKDEVFEILYQRAEEQMTPKTNFASAAASNWKNQWEQQQQAKKDALRGVLTEEQYQGYEKFLKLQEEMMNAIMPAAGATNGAAGVRTDVPP